MRRAIDNGRHDRSDRNYRRFCRQAEPLAARSHVSLAAAEAIESLAPGHENLKAGRRILVQWRLKKKVLIDMSARYLPLFQRNKAAH